MRKRLFAFLGSLALLLGGGMLTGLGGSAFEAKAEAQWAEAVEQINGYAAAPRVEVLRQGTRLHKIIMQFCGWELVRMEEV